MPVRKLPSAPSLEHLKNQAKDLQRRVEAADPDALADAREFDPRFASATATTTFTRTRAQLVVARRFGFASWNALRRHVEFVRENTRTPHVEPQTPDRDPADRFLRLACLRYGGDRPERRNEARLMLDRTPSLAAASIHASAAAGDVAASRAILGADPSLANRQGGPFGWPPILYLAYSRLPSEDGGRSTLDVARLLLDHGADPNAGFLWDGLPSPFTALAGVLGGGERDEPPHPQAQALARMLLSAGADPNDGQALYNRQFGAANDHLELLFEFGLGGKPKGRWHAQLGPALASPQQMLEDQMLWAASRNMPARVGLLLRQGVSPDGLGTSHPVHHGRTARQLAVLNGHTQIAVMFAEARPAAPMDPLIVFTGACMQADATQVDALLHDDPTLLDRLRSVAPHLVIRAAEAGRPAVVRFLVGLGFDVNAFVGQTALHAAAGSGHLETVRTLVELGGDPNRRDVRFHATPLGWAQHLGRADVAAWLAGRTKDDLDPNRGTPD